MTERAFQTQCPGCSTRFSVNERQLTVASGKVRCGVCLKVFKAHEHIPVPEEALEDFQSESILKTEQPVKSPTVPEPTPAPLTAEKRSGVAKRSASPGKKTRPTKKVDIDTLANQLDAFDNGTKGSAKTKKSSGPSSMDDPSFDQEAIPFIPSESIILEGQIPPNKRSSTSPLRFVQWGLVGILVLLLGAQSLYLMRDQGLRSATWQGVYHTLYQWIGQTPPAQFNPEAIRVYEIHLQPHETLGDALRLSFLLQNRAEKDQPFPALQLTFTDIKERKVASRIFQPWDYVDLSRFDQHLMPSTRPIQIQLDILNPGIRAVGYQVDVQTPSKNG
jgi:predicted Zn finger-like uncharacterized protein